MTSLVIRRSILCHGRRPLHITSSKNSVHNEPPIFQPVDRKRLRNIGIIAHINAGKTTTTERILYQAGSTDSVGDVDKGNTVTDYLDQERDRGITITSAAVSFNWRKHRINLIDTPGHVDFTIEVERSLAVLDGAVTIIDSSAGVEAQTITVWNQANRYKLPNIIFLNKYDKPQADYRMCMKDLRSNLSENAMLLHLPVKKPNQNFGSFIDIVHRKCFTWLNPDLNHGLKFNSETLVNFKDHLDRVEEERERLVNVLSDIDDQFAEKVLECDKISDISPEFISAAIRRATLQCQLSPVLLGSSFKYIGVQQLMDAIVDYLPSPSERGHQILSGLDVSEESSKMETNSAFIFKIMHDKRLGPLSYLRICSGRLGKLQRVKTLEDNKTEQVKKIYLPFADELKEIDGAIKDDIVVVTGLTESRTGDILVEQNFDLDLHQLTSTSSFSDDKGSPFQLLDKRTIIPQINQMEPVYFCSIESRNSAQQLKLEHALACLAREDPSFRYEVDEMGSTTIRGMGKLHLEVVRDRIQTEYKIEPLLGPLQISYRETVSGSATEELSVSRLINGINSQLTINLHVRPTATAVQEQQQQQQQQQQRQRAGGLWSGKMLKLDTSGENSLGQLRQEHRKAIENGLQSAMHYGPSLGFPVINCEITLMDFKANRRCGLPVISSAASQCLGAALRRCSPRLLEPIMWLEVVAPKQYNGLVISDISARRGLVVSTQARGSGDSLVVRSRTPLASLADYSEFLRITTSGRASFSMELFGYSEVGLAERQALGCRP